MEWRSLSQGRPLLGPCVTGQSAVGCGRGPQSSPGRPTRQPCSALGTESLLTKGSGWGSCTEPQRGQQLQRRRFLRGDTVMPVATVRSRAAQRVESQACKTRTCFYFDSVVTHVPRVSRRLWSCLHSVTSCNHNTNSRNLRTS